MIESISDFGKATAEDGRAIVSVVGDGVRSERSLVGRVFKAIDDIEIGLILHGSSPLTMSFVVSDSDVENVIARLHDVFFERLDPQVFQ